MLKYEKINWHEKNTIEIYNYMFKSLKKENEQYHFFKWLTQHNPNLDIDWIDCFEIFQESLFLDKQIDEVKYFADWYQHHFPDDYKDRYEYIEKFLCDYYFYSQDKDALIKRITFIQQHPTAGIDTITIRLLFQLIYHGYNDLAIAYAEAVWKPLQDAGKPTYPFIITIYANQLQQYYEAHLKGLTTNEQELTKQLIALGFDDDTERLNMVFSALKAEFSLNQVTESMVNGNDHYLLVLNIHFLKYMWRTYQVPFIFSECIWNFIATSKAFGKNKKLESWFYIEPKTLDSFLSKSLGSFEDPSGLEVFANVWGLQYVFEFLHKHELLSTEQYHFSIENVFHFRNELIPILGNEIWQTLFVFDWPKTNDDPIKPEVKLLFAETFEVDKHESKSQLIAYYLNYQTPSRIKKELKIDDDYFDPLLLEQKPFVKSEPSIGRNEPCPCGSGKKYKKCCLRHD